MSYQQILEAALALPAKKQHELLEQLEERLEIANGHGLSEEWLAEIDRRLAEYKAGGVPTITWEEAKRRMRKLRKTRARN
jgi:putative addiction module component (TIGR02574 family)